eukprot:TRINITY_DN46177_c0_g1_i1.p1 TRINITY_DN46177_c0_g1~~TRINITY_DN46177_c0_g1_i1.p1  ORF type:complete len:182 (+),score=26.62 TRINITY_DN46177_c0_g1_i1:64-609(+)
MRTSCSCVYFIFFFNDTATTEIYTRSIVGSVRCVQETAAVVPDDPNIEVISSVLVESKDLFKVQNEEGKTYEKIRSTWINNIGDIKQTEGYRIRVKSACSIEITGSQVSLPMSINLKAGSNLISFPYNGSVDAMQVIQPLIDAGALEKVQDQKGNSIEYWGTEIGWLNGIGNFNVGPCTLR